jgi:hypothetical protein
VVVRRKISYWEQYAGIVAATRAAARKLAIGLKLSPGEWQRLPDYVHPALKAIEAEQSWRLAAPSKPEVRRWFARLGMQLRLVPPVEVAMRDYEKCFVLSRGVFTDASLEAAMRKFKVFPAPAALRKFLIDWGEEHKPSNLPDKDRRHRSLILTDTDRQRLLSAKAGKGLAKCHVRIAQSLASWPCGQPSHEQLATAAGTSVRTVRRALPALRALGLLPDGRWGLSRIELPKHVWGFQDVMVTIAAIAGCSVKTLYRWEKDLRIELSQWDQEDSVKRKLPKQAVWRPKGAHARRKRGDAYE